METNQNKVNWFSLASIWFGGIVSVPALLIGSSLISSLTFGSALTAGFIGFCMVVTLMSIISVYAFDKQKSSVELAANSFGSSGANIIVGLVVGLSTLGWFGIQSNIAGASFSKIILDLTNFDFPVWTSTSFWGLVMLLTAVFGFKILKWLNYIAVPAIVLLIGYGVYATLKTHSIQEVFDYQPETEIPILHAIGLAIGFISVAMVIAPDYNRFAVTKKDAILGTIVGILPSALLLLAVGAFLAITQGTYDIVEIFASLGLPFFAMTILILATWTSNVMNMYSSGLAFNTMFNFNESTRSRTTIFVGLIGIMLAAMGVLNNFMNFISLLTITVTPIAGILVVDYFISKNLKSSNTVRFNWKGIAAWIIGAAMMLVIESQLKYVIGIVLAGFIYFVLNSIFKYDRAN